MKARVKWTDGRQFVAESGSGHSVVIDGPPDHGGRNTGPRPMEMLLMGMGSCTAFDILNILDKARAEVTNCVAELDAESLEAAEQQVDAVLRDVIAKSPELVEMLGARALQGKAYLPGSEDDVDAETDDS